MISYIGSIFFSILCFLKIHTINSILLDICILLLSLLFLFKKYYNISLGTILLWLVSPNIWLLFCSIFRNNLLHYTLIADVCTIIIISFFSNYILLNNIKKSKSILICMFGLLVLIYPYLPYEKYIYWITIFSIPVLVTSIFTHTTLSRFSNRYLLYAYFVILICTVTISFYHKKINNIAVLQSNWCDVAKEPDNNSYTMDYFYAYSDFLKILNSYAPTSIISNQTIKDNKLPYDAIVLITPTKPFSTEEVTNLLHFVRKGGRLIIIADHTNLYGHADVLNSLLHKVNIHLNDDTLYDNFDYYKDYHINIKSLILNRMYTKTNSSLNVPFYSYVWGISDIIISEKADYTKENFFGKLEFTEDDAVGSYPVGITLPYGLGNIIIWTDSTLFSNFAISQKNHLYLLDYLVTGKIIDDNIRKIPYKKLNIIAKQAILRETPPKFKPLSNQYSTLVANFTRYNIFPVYNAFGKDMQQLYIMTYDDFIKSLNKFENDACYIIIIDEIPDNNVFGAKKFDIFTKQKITSCNDKCFFSTDGLKITTKYKNSHIFFGKNVISDKELGTWWNTLPISPYKKYIIDKFNNWIINGEDVLFYNYPQNINIIQDMTISYDDGEKDKINEIKVSLPVKDNANNFIYMGNRQWGILLKENILLGGMETSDRIDDEKKLKKWTTKFNKSL